MDNKKLLSVLAYFIFFIPLVVGGTTEFGKFHANQGLNLLILFIGVSVVGTIIPILGWLIILPVGSLMCLVFAIGLIRCLTMICA